MLAHPHVMDCCTVIVLVLYKNQISYSNVSCVNVVVVQKKCKYNLPKNNSEIVYIKEERWILPFSGQWGQSGMEGRRRRTPRKAKKKRKQI
jgi:hypothetical protein